MEGKKVLKNAGWIIGCKIVQAVLAVVVTTLSARFLGPSGYGLVDYAAAIVTFVTPIMFLGFNSTIVQELIKEPEKEGETLGTAMLSSFFMSFLCLGGVVVFAAVANRGEKDTLIVCALYSALLMAQALEMIVYWFQAKLLSKYSSIISLIAYVIIAAYKIFLLATGKSVYWFAIANALDYGLIAIFSFIVYKKLGGMKLTFSWSTFCRMFRSSRYYILANMMVTIFAQSDKIMIKLYIDNAAVGYYSAAVTCANMTGFVFGAIIDSFRPLIFDNKKNDEAAFEKNMTRLYSIIIYFALLQSVAITIFSKVIIHILYGNEYEPSINALKIVVWYTTFSYFGSVRNIWLLAEEKQRYLLWINLGGALANIILNAFLIPVMGINGAALASLITQIFTNLIMGFILKPIRPNNRLIGKALNPMVLFSMIKKENNTRETNNERTDDR